MTEQTNPADASSASASVWRKDSYSLDHAFWVFLPIACLPCLTILLDGWQLLWFPHPACRTEAFILNGVQDAALGKPLYPPFGQMPYLVRVYNPLTYLPAALIGKVLRLDVVGMLLAGRLISLISSLLLAVLLFVWLRKYAGGWKAGLLAAVGLWFYHDMTLSEFFRLRPESPALLFTFAGVAVFLSQHRHRLFIAASLFFVAFLFKQWFIAAPISAALFLLLSKEYKNVLRFASMMAGLLAAFFLTMYALTGANYFYDTILALAVNEMHPIEKFFHFRPFIVGSLWSLILALPVALTLLLLQRRCRFLLLYFCVSLLWTFVSTGKVGASFNYFGETSILALAIVAAATVPQRRHDLAGVVVILFLLCLHLYAAVLNHGLLGAKMDVAMRDIGPYVERYKTMPGKKLLTDELIAARVGEVVGLDWVLLEHLMHKGWIDLSPLCRQIADGDYDVCVFATLPITALEMTMYTLAANGPYRLIFKDNTLIEFARVERPTGEK